MENTETPNNILVDVAKEAVQNTKEAVQDRKELGDTRIMVAVFKPEETMSVVEVNWQKALLVGLGMVSLGVIIWAGVNIYKSKSGKKDEEEEKGDTDNMADYQYMIYMNQRNSLD